MLRKKILLLLTLVLTVALVASGCGGDQQAGEDDKMKVAFMYVGHVGDGGYSYAHEQGRQYLESQLDYVESTYVEAVDDADAEQVLTNLANEGYQVIFSTSFGFMDPTLRVAERFPDTIFLHCSGYKIADNMGTYFGRMYQARYLSGIVAGATTESNLIGYVAAYPIPEVIRGINAFTLGARSVNPEAKVRVIWTNTWYDPSSEKRAADVLLDEGADIIAQHQDTPGPMQAAQERGKLSIGYNSDMRVFAPEAVMTSAIWNWGPYYVDVIEAIREGTWTTSQYWGSMSDNIVGLAPYGSMVSEEVKMLVEDEKQRIHSGEWDVFYGPIYNQQGELVVAEGESLTDEEMLEMNWFVEGVEGNITQ